VNVLLALIISSITRTTADNAKIRLPLKKNPVKYGIHNDKQLFKTKVRRAPGHHSTSKNEVILVIIHLKLD
jgi:hypothetical protein